ncbi:hypothetical protein L3Y34_005401 [Caenorhabditis briggsae]|nr:hypothetical protein L3Y34_005401 [Caenorhabditis briggsae]
MQPVPLYPLVAVYTVGVLSDWFGIPPVALSYIVCDLIAVQFTFLAVSFIKKHRTVASLSNSLAFPKHSDIVILVALVLGVVLGDSYVLSMRLSREDQWKLVNELVPHYVDGFRSLPNFEIFPKTSQMNYSLYILLAFAISVLTPMIFVVLDTFRKLHQLKQKIAKVNYQRHAEGVICLIVQVGTAGLSIAPIIRLGISIIFDHPDAQKVSEFCLAWFSTHSSFNMIALLMFFPPYKMFIKKHTKG